MYELIAKITLLSSLLGMGLILFRKIPALRTLPLPESESKKTCPVSAFAERFFASFSFLNFLEKLLLKLRIFTLRIENIVTVWLEKLRRHSKNQESDQNSNYWKELKKAKSEKR